MAISTTDFLFVRDLVHERTGIRYSSVQFHLVESRLSAMARAERLASATELVARLRGTGGDSLRQRVVETMPTTETLFFRDFAAFETIRTEILPELIERRAESRKLTIWCAAAATGQEPYSVAMLLSDDFQEALAGWDVTILATDISSDSLAKAQMGRYSQMEVNHGLPAAKLIRHFQQVGTEWQIRAKLRQQVDFRTMNLIHDWHELPPADLILMRNVLGSFDTATRRSTLARAACQLQPDGFLMLGLNESDWELDDPFLCVNSASSRYFQIDQLMLAGSTMAAKPLEFGCV